MKVNNVIKALLLVSGAFLFGPDATKVRLWRSGHLGSRGNPVQAQLVVNPFAAGYMKLQQKLNEFVAKQKELQAQVDAMQAILSGLEKKQGQVDVLRERVFGEEGVLPAVNTNFERVNTTFDCHAASLAGLKEGEAQRRSNLDQFNANFTYIRDELEKIKAAMQKNDNPPPASRKRAPTKSTRAVSKRKKKS